MRINRIELPHPLSGPRMCSGHSRCLAAAVPMPLKAINSVKVLPAQNMNDLHSFTLTRGSQGSQANTPYSLPCAYLTRLWRKYGGSSTPLHITSTRWSLLVRRIRLGPRKSSEHPTLTSAFAPPILSPGQNPPYPSRSCLHMVTWSLPLLAHGCFPPPPPLFLKLIN